MYDLSKVFATFSLCLLLFYWDKNQASYKIPLNCVIYLAETKVAHVANLFS